MNQTDNDQCYANKPDTFCNVNAFVFHNNVMKYFHLEAFHSKCW